ncbi:Cytochrome P450 3A21 [Araneus ventricosus]|uniref:Cytochrome P450 3A21 n=1 Tax=Araneus ventricosus TaxID=182803 RepID=A0A4Y2MJ84_ARAVE|nr:Cytochrome P450 3A21 [Araneus ventricosus]
MEIYVALLSVAVVLWLAWRWKKLSLWQNLGIPGPKPNLIFGNLLELYKKGPLKCHEEWVKKYGRVLGYFYGMKPVLLVTDPYLLKNIFIKDFNKFINREAFNPLHKYSLKDKRSQTVLILPGQAWKDVRSVLTPTFTTSKMKQMSGSMNSSIETMLEILQEKAQKGIVFDIFDVYQRLTMDVITKTAFGVQTDVQTNMKSSILRATKLIFVTPYKDAIIFIGLTFPILRKLCMKVQVFIITLLNKGRPPHTMLRRGIRKVMEMRRKNPETKKNDLLQLMLDSSVSVSGDVDVSRLEAGNAELEKRGSEEISSKKTRSMEDDEIESSAFTVLLAGYETTSTALAYTTYFVAKHQDVQENLYQEIKDLIERGQKLEYATINKLPYLDKVLNESMRMYPPVHLFTNRYALEDVQYGDIHIPKGTLIQAPVYLMHHDPDFWSEPEIFDPERFSTKPNSEGITYLPFGVGPRNCLGMRFAQLEAKLALANIVYKFHIKLDEKLKDNLEVLCQIRTLTPAKGHKTTNDFAPPKGKKTPRKVGHLRDRQKDLKVPILGQWSEEKESKASGLKLQSTTRQIPET